MASSPMFSKTRSSNRIASLPDEDEKGKGSDEQDGETSKTQKKTVGASPKSPKKETKALPKDPKKEGTLSNKADAKNGADSEGKDDMDMTATETDKSRKRQKMALPTRQMPPRSTKSPKAGSSTSSGNPKDPSPVALLDMLAEVAAATLSKDSGTPKAAKIAQRKKIMKKLAEVKLKQQTNSDRPNLRSETLNLDQLRTLSDKLLLNMFAEMTADEMRRNYTFACYLVPDKCHQKYHSFGNEIKARLQMKTHLLGHIAELLAETNAEGKIQKGNFTAEPVLARKRRLAVEEENAKKRKRTRKQPPPKPEPEKITGPKAKAKDFDSPPKHADAGSDSSEFTKVRKLEKSVEKEKLKAKESPEGKAIADPGLESEADSMSTTKILVKHETCDQMQDIACEYEEVAETTEGEDGAQGEVEIDYDQPHHDHCYTLLSGEKKVVPEFFDEYDDEFEAEDQEYNEDGEVVGNIDCGASSKVQTVFIGEATSDATYEIEQNSDGGDDEEPETSEVAEPQRSQQTETAIRQLEALRALQIQKSRKQVYPPVKLLEEEMARSLEDDSLGSLDDEDIQQGSPDWERKLALQCIRYLRTKKKDEHVALVCRICKGRAFTAQATLMYHYRSHAGIKPFVCSICNTTFTRQHSLNYHMLIHNNKSRFTCGDCGRKFRHPSHFKEHMRRHTGETPFECSDCCVRFKTRNTYKRHLKTRHGKLLTANGIVPLTAEEFQKVKTNPKRRPRKDQETQWPEPEIILHADDDDQPTISAVESLVAMQIKENAEDGNMILPGELEEEEEEEEANCDETEEGEMAEISGDSVPISVDVDTSMEPILAEFNNETQLIHISDDNKVTFLRADSSSVNSDGMKTIVLTPIDIKPDGSGAPEWLTGNMDMCTIQAVSLSPYLKCT